MVPSLGARGASEIDADAVTSAAIIMTIDPNQHIIVAIMTLLFTAITESVTRGVASIASGLRVTTATSSTAESAPHVPVVPAAVLSIDAPVIIATAAPSSLRTTADDRLTAPPGIVVIAGIAVPITNMAANTHLETMITPVAAVVNAAPAPASVHQTVVVDRVTVTPVIPVIGIASASITTATII